MTGIGKLHLPSVQGRREVDEWEGDHVSQPRRRFMIVSLGMAVLGGFSGRASRVAAQEDDEFKLLQSIAMAEIQARWIYRQVSLEKAPLSVESTQRYLKQEFESRTEFQKIMEGWRGRDIAWAVQLDQRELFDAMINAKVDPIPKKEGIEIYVLPEPKVDKGDKEELAGVILDILLESFIGRVGIAGIRSYILESKWLGNDLTKISAAIKKGNWNRVARLFLGLLERLLSRTTIAALEKKLGREVIFRLLANASARFLPFVGYAYWVIAVGIAIKNNSGRLRRAI